MQSVRRAAKSTEALLLVDDILPGGSTNSRDDSFRPITSEAGQRLPSIPVKVKLGV